MLSLPNLLTLSRIAVIPVVIGLLYVDGALARWLACAFYAAACATDYFDGYLARLLGQISPLGRFLDPIADKLLVAAVILCLVASDQISGLAVLAALIILMREILVSGLREYLAEIQVPLPVSRLSKWKTGIQMIALGLLILASAGPATMVLQEIGEVGLWVAAILTLVTGYDYLYHGLRHIASGPAVRRSTHAQDATHKVKAASERHAR